MNASNQISAAVFSAFVKCPTKVHLLAIGEPAPGAFFVDIEARISSMYKPVARRQLHTGAKVAELLEFGRLWCSLDDETILHYVDCDTVVYDFALPQHGHGGRQPQKSSPSANFVPVLFLPWDKPNLSDSLLVCFGALALSQATGILADSREPPPLVLNRYCAVCDFQPRCRPLAIEHDDLSLLTAMIGKERAKCSAN